MSEPTFTDEQLDAVAANCGYVLMSMYDSGCYDHDQQRKEEREDVRAILNAALAQGVVALPPAKVEDARVQAAIENLKCWAEEWDQTGMSHEAALCRQMAETVERLAAERQDVASPRSVVPGAQGGRLARTSASRKAMRCFR